MFKIGFPLYTFYEMYLSHSNSTYIFFSPVSLDPPRCLHVHSIGFSALSVVQFCCLKTFRLPVPVINFLCLLEDYAICISFVVKIVAVNNDDFKIYQDCLKNLTILRQKWKIKSISGQMMFLRYGYRLNSCRRLHIIYEIPGMFRMINVINIV